MLKDNELWRAVVRDALTKQTDAIIFAETRAMVERKLSNHAPRGNFEIEILPPAGPDPAPAKKKHPAGSAGAET